MTYKEFMQWAEENEELKAVIPEALARWFNRDDVMEQLKYITIYPNEYTNVPDSDGCYQDSQGNWYYYTQLDERTSLVPNGKKYSEEECFEKLKTSVMYKLQRLEGRRENFPDGENDAPLNL